MRTFAIAAVVASLTLIAGATARRAPRRDAGAAAASTGRSTACSAPTTGPRCNAAFRSIRRSAPPATRASYLYFRDLTALGYTEDQVKGIAAAWPQQVTDGPNDTGQMFQRPARPSDRIPGPFPNDQAARAANNGALAARSVADRQGARGRRRLCLCDPDRVRAAAGQFQDDAGHVLQRLLPRPSDRDAAAAEPGSGHVCRQDAGDGAADGARCRRVS